MRIPGERLFIQRHGEIVEQPLKPIVKPDDFNASPEQCLAGGANRRVQPGAVSARREDADALDLFHGRQLTGLQGGDATLP